MSNNDIHNNKTNDNLILEHPNPFIQKVLGFHEINSKNIDSVKKNLSNLIPTYVIDNKGVSNVRYSNLSLRFLGITPSLLDRLQQDVERLYNQPFEIFTSINAFRKFEENLPQAIKGLKQECFLDVDNEIDFSKRIDAYRDLSSIKRKIHDLYELFAQTFEDIESKQWAAEEEFLEYIHDAYSEDVDYFGWNDAQILKNHDYFDELESRDDFERDDYAHSQMSFRTPRMFRF